MIFGVEWGHDRRRTFPSREKIGNDQLEFWLSQHLNTQNVYEFRYEHKDVVIIEIPPARK